MAIDGFARASSKTVNPQLIEKHLRLNDFEKLVLIPDYEIFKNGKPLPIDGNKKPIKDQLLRFFKKKGNSIQKGKIAAKIEKSNNFLKQLHTNMPHTIIPVIGANIALPKCMSTLEQEFDEWKFSGIHIPNHILKADLITPTTYDLYQWIESKQLSVIINLNGDNDLHAIQKVIRDFEKINFIIQHLVGIEKFATSMYKLQNCWFDLSPMYAISDHRLKNAIDIAGPNNLLYGSGFPYHKHLMIDDKERLSQIGLNQNDIEKITNENWKQIFTFEKEPVLV
jgi:hypothetical protein